MPAVEVRETVFTDGAPFSDALVDLLRDVDPAVARAFVGRPTAEVARVLADGTAAEVRALFGGQARVAWQAVIADPELITLDGRLLARTGLNTPAARRRAVAGEIASAMERTPFIPGRTFRGTKLGQRIIAQQFAHRFNATLIQEAHVRQAGRMVDGLIADYRRGLKGLLGEMNDLMAGARTAAEREAIAARIASRTGVIRARVAGLRQLTEEFAERFAGELDRSALAALRDGVNRAIDRMWDTPFPGNPVAAQRAAGTSVVDIRRAFFQAEASTLEVALGNTPLLAGRVAREAIDGIADIVTRTSILRGADSRFAAREIAREWGTQLRGLKLKVDTRAKFIARTETARIQAEADLRSMGRLGVRRVDVFYSGGAFPCRICPDIADGGPYSVDRVPEGGVPFHPNCYSADTEVLTRRRGWTTFPALQAGDEVLSLVPLASDNYFSPFATTRTPHRAARRCGLTPP